WGEKNLLQAEIDNKIGAYIRGTISNSNMAVQQAVAAALTEDMENCDSERATIAGILGARWLALKKALDSADLSGAKTDPFNSGFFGFLNLETPADALADALLTKHKLGVIPLTEPDVNVNGIRIAFCSVEENLIPETVDRIADAIKNT
ncbi:MAG: aminotransferase class I/II-fold pyridoxal phosphate-dependent enzyme, partial [bacterium]